MDAGHEAAASLWDEFFFIVARVATCAVDLRKDDFSLTLVEQHLRPYRQGAPHVLRHVRNGVHGCHVIRRFKSQRRSY